MSENTFVIEMKRLIILGAGTAGTMMANHLRKKLRKEEWDITIVDERREHYYQPGLLFVPFGIYKPEQTVKPIEQFIPDSKEDKLPFKSLLKLISEEEKQDQDWGQFAIHFDQVHNNFLKNISKAFPELTQGDLKICAYLKMGLSSKEIAQLLIISPKGVEVARYRLRKKLGIEQDVNLHNFIDEFA